MGFGKSCFQDKIIKEVNAFVDFLSQKKEKPFEIQDIFRISIANVILSISYGKRYNFDDEWLKTCLNGLEHPTKTLRRANGLDNILPFLKYFPGDLLKSKSRARHYKQFMTHVNKVYEEHIQSHDATYTRDFMDSYISEMNRRTLEEESEFTSDQLGRIVRDLFGQERVLQRLHSSGQFSTL